MAWCVFGARRYWDICNTWWRHGENLYHDDVIKWSHFPRYWPFVRGIHRPPVNSPHKGQWRGTLMFTLICARINGWVNNCEAGDLRRNRAHYDVIVMYGGSKVMHCWQVHSRQDRCLQCVIRVIETKKIKLLVMHVIVDNTYGLCISRKPSLHFITGYLKPSGFVG